ncbi:uncharacterized protein LOC130711107 [Lotus japonicus]|uniref:uncharacterized protein LOC130711107 n=1 Tax=Lotus japonicus TaxID=34305 RepID=UPI00258879EA|nr:uncharacterized protein LOC130711107 [Lotus japonicus]
MDEDDRALVQTLQQDYVAVGDYLCMEVRVRRELRNMIYPESESSIVVSWDELLSGDISSIERNLCDHHVIPPEFIPSLASNVVSRASELVQDCPLNSSHESPHRVDFVLDITAPDELFKFWESCMEEEESDEPHHKRVKVEEEEEEESEEPHQKKVKVEEEDADTEGCCICLTEFEEGVQVFQMPCKAYVS